MIKVAVGISSRTRFIRDGGMEIKIATVKQSDVSGNAKAATLLKMPFDQNAISAAVGDSLRAEFTLTKIQTQAQNNGHTRDGVEIKKNSTKFEPDFVDIDVSVSTIDQANNASTAVKRSLTGDTRAPGISVLYPADNGRFTGANRDTDFDKFLNPLQLRVDEPLDSLFVYADGTETADDVTAENFIETAAILLWKPDGGRIRELSRVIKAAGPTTVAVGDTVTYNTTGLKWKKGNNDLDATGQGGTKIDLKIVAVDKVGNRTVETLNDVFHDQKVPSFKEFFPRRGLLADDNFQINDETRHPVITLKEAVDSIAVTYDPSPTGTNIVEERSGNLTGEQTVLIDEPFVDGRTYSLTIFARDLAGNSYKTPAADAANLKFNAGFANPKANMFVVKNVSPAESDSVVAGQAFYLEIQAVDNNGTPDNMDDDRKALTYKNKDADGNTASEVRISAWDADGAAKSVFFHGKGVTDNDETDGMATLNADVWALGKRTVYAKSKKPVDDLKILVEHRNAGMGGTSVAAFDGAIEDLTVDAADFRKFKIVAVEDGVERAAGEAVWGDFTLKVIPVDNFGNPSVKAYKADPRKGKNQGIGNAASVAAATDSLNVLDTRLKDNAHNHKNGIRVSIGTTATLPGIPSNLTSWLVPAAGASFPTTAPENISAVQVQVSVLNSFIPNDMRSQNIVSDATITIQEPVDLSITLWVPGMDTDQAGETVTIPAGGEVMVTARAEGLNEGDMVTFNVDGEETEATADADGYAGQPITLTGSGTVSVTATSGQYSESLDIVHEEQAGRREFTDANGDPVYLVDLSDNTVNENDITAFVGAYLSSAGDANYNPQADADDSGTVDDDDLALIVTSWLKTAANGPATKPILLSGVNANAEFALNLGSERVIAGELMAVDVSLANVEALMGYGFKLNYDATKFEFVSVAPADEDLLTSTGGEALSHHVVTDGQVSVVTGMYNGTAVSGGGDIVRFVFRVLYEFEDNARFEIADGLVFDPTNLSNPAVVAGVLELQSTPREFALHQNFPNPFNPDTTIKYDLAESADVTLQIYNVLGQVVRTLVASEAQNAGRYQIRWNGMDERGVPVSSGIYFYQISADGMFSDVRKLMLLK